MAWLQSRIVESPAVSGLNQPPERFKCIPASPVPVPVPCRLRSGSCWRQLSTSTPRPLQTRDGRGPGQAKQPSPLSARTCPLGGLVQTGQGPGLKLTVDRTRRDLEPSGTCTKVPSECITSPTSCLFSAGYLPLMQTWHWVTWTTSQKVAAPAVGRHAPLGPGLHRRPGWAYRALSSCTVPCCLCLSLPADLIPRRQTFFLPLSLCLCLCLFFPPQTAIVF